MKASPARACPARRARRASSRAPKGERRSPARDDTPRHGTKSRSALYADLVQARVDRDRRIRGDEKGVAVGADLAAASAPMLPLAPGRLSTMNCCLSDSESAGRAGAHTGRCRRRRRGTMNLTVRGPGFLRMADKPVIPGNSDCRSETALHGDSSGRASLPRLLAFARSVAY